MPDTKTTSELTKSPIIGDELVRLTTPGGNYKASVSAIIGAVAALRSNNLTDLGNVAMARVNLGLGNLAQLNIVTLTEIGPTCFASLADAQAGIDNTKLITPYLAKAAALAGIGNALTGIDQYSKITDYTFVLADAGRTVLHPGTDSAARMFTIPSNASVAYVIGTVLGFINQNGGGLITIAIASDTMRLAGSGATGSRTLSANGVATAQKITATEWIISGTGLS